MVVEKTLHRAASGRPLIGALLACLFLSVGSGCEKPRHSPQAVEAFVDQWLPTVEPEIRAQLAEQGVAKLLQTRLEAAARQEQAQTGRAEPPYERFLQEAYARRAYQLAFVQDAGLSPRGQALWTALQEAHLHLLPVERYGLQDIRTRLATLESKRQAFEALDKLAPGPEERAFAANFVQAQPPEQYPLEPAQHEALTQALLEGDAGERLRQARKSYEDLATRQGAVQVELEHLLARALVRYARDVRHHRLPQMFVHPREDDFYNEQEIRQLEKPPQRPPEAVGPFQAGLVRRRATQVAEAIAKNPVPLLHAALARTLGEVMEAEDAGSVLERLPPTQPQYRALLKARQRYQAIVDAGGWQPVTPARNLQAGARAPAVPALRERLHKEGFLAAAHLGDDLYDAELHQAVRAYQETHQMEVSGKPHQAFWTSLNVPAERRLKQIELNIRRWRDTNAPDPLDYYAFVNLPDFTIELWRENKRLMRFPVVIGNNDLVENAETGEKERANRTPFPLSGYIDRVIYNPYWNVTPRIRAEEIMPEVKRAIEADYLARLKRLKGSEGPEAPPKEGGSGGGEAKEEEARFTGREPLSFASTARLDAKKAPPLFTLPMVEEAARQVQQAGAGPEHPLANLTPAKLREHFPYLNLETGEVDVSLSKPEDIPAWYKANGYEVAFPGRTFEYVRMPPGPGNALGRVKIIFPNLHDVYFHDTPAKDLFARPVRAYSHGCMRLQDPLGLARTLLEQDGQFEEAHIQGVLRSGGYTPIFLKREVPVFVEYYTVRVDEEGRVHFLSDIYGHDRLD